jgi:hypothetical protein
VLRNFCPVLALEAKSVNDSERKERRKEVGQGVGVGERRDRKKGE